MSRAGFTPIDTKHIIPLDKFYSLLLNQSYNPILYYQPVQKVGTSTPEEISATAEELAAQAEHLQSATAFFNTNGAGRTRRDDVRTDVRDVSMRTVTDLVPEASGKKRQRNVEQDRRQDGDGRDPGGYSIHLEQAEIVGDEQDEEFERF